MTTEQVKLKPCPFCGCEVRLEKHRRHGEFGPRVWWYIKGDHVGIGGCCPGEVRGRGSAETAIAAWNTRPAPDAALLRCIVSHASGGNLDLDEHPGMGLNAICVEISRHHNRIWESGNRCYRAPVANTVLADLAAIGPRPEGKVLAWTDPRPCYYKNTDLNPCGYCYGCRESAARSTALAASQVKPDPLPSPEPGEVR